MILIDNFKTKLVGTRAISRELSERDQMWVTDDDTKSIFP